MTCNFFSTCLVIQVHEKNQFDVDIFFPCLLEDMSIPEKILAYNRANRAVAILCNHQRAVPKGFDKSMDALNAKVIFFFCLKLKCYSTYKYLSA